VIAGQWRGHVMRADIARGADRYPVIDRSVRAGFAQTINRRRARMILRDSEIAPGQRAAMVEDLAHLLGVSQSSSGAMLHHLHLLQSAPPADRPAWRQMVASGDVSLAMLTRQMHDRYHPQEVFAR